MSENRETFRQLIDAMADGSEDAAWELTRLYSPHILRVVRSSLPRAIRTKVDSQDFLQSVWATMLLKPDDLLKFREQGQFLRYLAGVAKHKVVDKYRHFSTAKNNVHAEVRVGADDYRHSQDGDAAMLVSGPLLNDDPAPSQVAIVRECWQRVVDSSSPRDQRIARLRLQGMTYESIALTLGIDERTARRSVKRMVHEFQR